MGVYKEIAKADGSGITTFYRLSEENSTVETTSTGTTKTMFDYNDVLNKPSINDVALVGNKTLDELGIQPAGDYITEIPAEYITEDELEAKDYATEAFVIDQINNAEHFHREIVDALPLTGKDNILYLVPKKGSDKDIYNEYIWTGVDYEFMGTTAVDLTDYYQKNEVDELLDNKVTKVSGKQLSTNDYTTAEKTKLASLENYDDSELRSKVDSLHNYDDTAIKLDIQELKKDASTNEIDIASIENELGYKAEVIRLVKNGDWWLCQDAKGNNLTLEMAMNRLGLPKTILLLENPENDGKYYPVEYELQEKYIDVIYKDLDGITHHLNYGYNEYFTNTASGDYIHLEDSINYPYKELSVDGVCEQETTSGKNYFNILSAKQASTSQTSNGITFTYNADGTITANGTNPSGTQSSVEFTLPEEAIISTTNKKLVVTLDGGSISGGFAFVLRDNSYNNIKLIETSNLGTKFANLDNDKLIVKPRFYTYNNTTLINVKIKIMVIDKDTTDYTYEPFTNLQPSPSPDYPQEIKTIEKRLPSEYQEVEYIESTGTQYINTGIKATINTSIKLKIYSIDKINNTGIFGDEWAINKFFLNYDSGYGWHFVNGNPIKIAKTNGYKVIEAKNGYIKINNTVREITPLTSYSSKVSVLLLACRSYKKFIGKLYYCKFYENDALVRDYIPCYRKSDNEIGLYDLVNNEFYTNQGTGTFLKGEDKDLIITSDNGSVENYLCSRIIVNLPEDEFIGKINDTYKDTLKVEYNEEDGQYHLNLHKNIKKIVMNANSTNLSRASTSDITKFRYLYKLEDKANANTAEVKSNKIVYSSSGSWNCVNSISVYGNKTQLLFYIEEISQMSINDAISWINQNNIEVYYVLETPYVLDLGIVDIPITYNEITNLFTDSDLMPTINIEYYTEILENAKDTIIGQDIYLQNEVDNVSSLPADANKGDIRRTKDTKDWYIYDGTEWSAFDKASEVDLSNYLAKDNTVAYKPATDYNPSTKKYVDDSIADIFIPTKVSQLTNDSGFVLKSTNDLTNYYNKSNTYNKAEVNALVSSSGGGSKVSITVNGDTLVITTGGE